MELDEIREKLIELSPIWMDAQSRAAELGIHLRPQYLAPTPVFWEYEPELYFAHCQELLARASTGEELESPTLAESAIYFVSTISEFVEKLCPTLTSITKGPGGWVPFEEIAAKLDALQAPGFNGKPDIRRKVESEIRELAAFPTVLFLGSLMAAAKSLASRMSSYLLGSPYEGYSLTTAVPDVVKEIGKAYSSPELEAAVRELSQRVIDLYRSLHKVNRDEAWFMVGLAYMALSLDQDSDEDQDLDEDDED